MLMSSLFSHQDGLSSEEGVSGVFDIKSGDSLDACVSLEKKIKEARIGALVAWSDTAEVQVFAGLVWQFTVLGGSDLGYACFDIIALSRSVISSALRPLVLLRAEGIQKNTRSKLLKALH